MSDQTQNQRPTLTEDLRERARKEKPDEFTLAWWGDRFDSMQQVIHGQNAIIAKQEASIADLWAELIRVREEGSRTVKAVGEGKTAQAQTDARLDKWAQWAKTQQGKQS